MSKTKITTPVAGYAGTGPGDVVFEDGVGYTDDEAALNYYRAAGYKVGSESPVEAEQAEVIDARDASEPQPVGTRLRDAAVDPQPGDFLVPTNAGKADPHGPLVVAPGIHAVESQVIRPGEVHVDDIPKQDDAETEQAKRLLVDNEDALQVTGDPDGDRGPLELSDPGSAHLGVQAAKAVAKAEKQAPGADAAPAPAKKAAAKKTAAKPRS